MPANRSNERKNQPLKKDDIQKNPDKHIDHDFKGQPHNPSKENIIRPGNKTEKLNADLLKNLSPGTKPPKMNELRKELEDVDEQQSDGSGGAFSETEGEIEAPDEEDETGKIY